jgi:hypothetical protein
MPVGNMYIMKEILIIPWLLFFFTAGTAFLVIQSGTIAAVRGGFCQIRRRASRAPLSEKNILLETGQL